MRGATITGTPVYGGYYSNSTHSLVLNAGTLTVSAVSGLCLGLINNGDHVVYAASYVVYADHAGTERLPDSALPPGHRAPAGTPRRGPPH